MKIGFFDSGVGGLSVLHRARLLMPQQNFIYYADEAHVPYGSRSRQEILSYTRQAAETMLDMGAKALVIACNTATSVAAESLRRELDIPIIGIEPAVKKALEQCPDKRVLVAATPVTIAGEKMHDLVESLDSHHQVDTVSLGDLVPYAEREELDSARAEDYIRRQLQDFSLEDYGCFVLGCTHFNYFKEPLRRILPEHIAFVDGNEGTVRQLMRRMAQAGLEPRGEGQVEYCFSGEMVTDPEQLGRIERYMAVLDKVMNI